MPSALTRPLSRLLAVVLSALLALAGLVAFSPPAAADSFDVSDGYLDWGLSATYRLYVPNTPEGKVTLSDGLTENEDGTYRWPVTEGTFDSETGALDVRFAGTANFYGHSGLMDLTISDLHLVATGYGTATLYADYSSLVGGETLTGDDVSLGTIDATKGGTVDVPEGALTWDGVYTTLAGGAVPAFAGYYSTGQVLDTVDLSLTGGWAAGTVETWHEQGAATIAEISRISPPDGATWSAVSMDQDRGIAFAVASDGATYVYDTGTQELLQTLTGVSVLATGPLSVLDEETGEVLATVAGVRTFLAPNGDGTYRVTDKTLPTSISPTSIAYDQATGSIVFATLTAKALYTRGGDGSYTLAKTYAASTRTRGNPVFFDPSTGDLLGVYSTSDGTTINSTLLRYAVGADSLTLTSTMTLDVYASEVAYWTQDPDTGDLYAAGGLFSNNGTAYAATSYRIAVIRDDAEVAVYDYPTSEVSSLWISLDAENDVLFTAHLGHAVAYDVSDVSSGMQPLASGEWSTDGLGTGGTSIAANGSAIAAVGDGSTVWVPTPNAILVQSYGTTPSFTTDPADTTVTIEASADSATTELSVAAEGDGVSLQWQEKVPGDIAFRDIDGATSATLPVTATSDDDGTQYRVVATNAYGTVVSDAATLSVQTAPVVTTQPGSASAIEGSTVTFTAAGTGRPAPAITWQVDDGSGWTDLASGDDVTAEGGTLTLTSVAADEDGSQYRAVFTSDAGVAYSDAATLRVTASTTPEEETTYDGVVFDWTVSADAQHRPPNGSAAHYFSAGVSDGTEATYTAESDGVTILQRDGSGGEAVATWDTRGQHVTLGGSATQAVQLSEGTATVQPDGTAVVTWPGTFSVNYYDGLVPFTLTNIVLTVDADGAGTLTADLSGYAGDMADPTAPKDAVAPASGVTVATFSGVVIDTTGSITVTPAFAGVEITTPDGATAQNRTASGWGAWPQGFVDFQQTTGLAAYFYTTGGTLDSSKAPAAFTLDFTAAAAEHSAPTVTTQPVSVSVGEGQDAVFTAAAAGTPAPTVQWQSKLADAGDWVDIPGATGFSYTASAVTASVSGTQYRAVFANSAGTATTEAATLTVTELPSTGGGDGGDSGSGDSGSEGTGSGSSWSASEDDLTGVDQGGVSAPSSAAAGTTILVTVGGGHEGETVHAYLFSEPVSLGSHVVSTTGTISVTLPSDVTGDHRIAVYAADGTLIGWAPITITDPAALAVTGGGFPAGAVWAGGILMLLGAAAVGAGIRRRRAA